MSTSPGRRVSEDRMDLDSQSQVHSADQASGAGEVSIQKGSDNNRLEGLIGDNTDTPMDSTHISGQKHLDGRLVEPFPKSGEAESILTEGTSPVNAITRSTDGPNSQLEEDASGEAIGASIPRQDNPSSTGPSDRVTPAPDVEMEYVRRSGPTGNTSLLQDASRAAISNDQGHGDMTSRATDLPAKGKPHGAEARRYLNENVTPHLLEGMKYLAVAKPKKPLLWLSEFLKQKSADHEDSQ